MISSDTHLAEPRTLFKQRRSSATPAFDDQAVDDQAVGVPDLDQQYSYFLSTTERRDIEILPQGLTRDITNLHRLNDVRYLNKFFKSVNRILPEGGYFTGCVETSELQKQETLSSHPAWIAWPLYTLLFLFKRVLPKLKLTQKLYFAITKGRNRMLSKPEVLGRLVCCGFEIIDHRDVGSEMYFVVQKKGDPVVAPNPSYGPIFKMRRTGKGGKPIYCYKLRTMHPYAEYLQAYIYEKNSLQDSGKFKDDFRITTWGAFLRKTWLDELPMVVNLLKGDIKLIGVRPLSSHYLSLYPDELVQQRLQYRPGLLPPYYADLPKNFDEILASEKKYLETYAKSPFKTDFQYFTRVLNNIIVKGARSQ